MKSSKLRSLFPAVFLLFFTSVSGQTNGEPKPDELQRRIAELERQIKAISVELADLKRTSQPASAAEKEVAVPTAQTAAASTQPAPRALTAASGDVKITPYGTIYFNAFGNNGGVNNSDVPMWAATGPSSSSSSVRQTRLGLKVDGIRAGNARVAAVVEADFFGGVPGVAIGENFGVVRLRLAHVRLDWEKTSLTVGQDWMVFAPQNPVSLAAAAIPQLAAAGNNWARLPQIRIERRFSPNIALQAAVLAPQTGDSPGSPQFLLQPNSGAASIMPFLQSRIVFSGKNWLGSGKSGSVGISGHFGRSRIFQGTPNTGRNIDSTGIAADWNFPLAKRVSVSGEVFFGRNLGGFQAGIFQGYNPDSAVVTAGVLQPRGVRPITTRGGWVQAGFVPKVLKDRLALYASFGIDDPSDEDLLSVVPRDWRTQNTAFAFDAIYKITPQFSFGAEVRSFRTMYFLSGTRTSTHVNLGAAYSF